MPGARLARNRVVWLAALAIMALSHAAAAGAQIRLRLRVSPTTVRFLDANPTTTPVVSAYRTIRIRVRVRNAMPTDTWSVNALAGGDLLSGPDAIPASSVSWTATQGGGPCNCACQVGTISQVVPQLMLVGQGNTPGSDVRCGQRYLLANRWTYAPGGYSQSVTITLTSP